ncbi:MAG: hypothetical protein U9O96_05145 [Candidatus Thermoplasmatota archaeon]|nr:hypothetical protein [Candidatus Thermoplasmatota archaeon]
MGKLFDGETFEKIGFLDLLRVVKCPMLIPKILLLRRGTSITMRWEW